MAAALVPLFNERALVVHASDGPVLVAGDLHLGLEAELRRKGVHGLDESKGLVAHLAALAAREKATRVVLLGDVKHGLGAREAEARALAPLGELGVPVEVVPGNHDGAIGEIAPFLALHDARGTTLDGIGLVHGHTWPVEAVIACERVVLCHNHPHVALDDELGGRISEPCWVRAPFDSDATRERYGDVEPPREAVLVPAFNHLLGGVALNRAGERALGPLLANGLVDLDRGRVFTLDGVDLGTIAHLRDEARGV